MIYFDNSATSPIDEEVLDAMIPYLKEEYGNPSSKYYCKAINAKAAVENARANVAKLLGASEEEIVFTSGATESTNFIIKGYMDYRRFYEDGKNHVITSNSEHKATLNTCKFLNGELYSNNDPTVGLMGEKVLIDRGYEVSFIPVSRIGEIETASVEKSIKNNTALASFIYVNNEVGTINNIKELAEICKSRDVKIHSDLTQALGKLRINVSDLGLDFASCSAHKIYGPKGIGAAFLKSDAYGIPPITVLLHGGEQEYGLRAGTLAVPNIVGFGKAAEIALRDMDNTEKHIKRMDEYALRKLQEIEEVELCNPTEKRIPGIISILINKTNFHNERFIKQVSDQLAISSGSACSAGEPSYVIKAMGLEEKITKVLRITINKHTSKEDIDQLVTIISNTI